MTYLRSIIAVMMGCGIEGYEREDEQKLGKREDKLAELAIMREKKIILGKKSELLLCLCCESSLSNFLAF